MSDPKQILAAAKRILLVDWPDTSLPRILIGNGYSVFGASPNKYTEASVVADRPSDSDGVDIFAPKDETETGYLVFRKLDSPPTNIDIVNVFRPENELAGIIVRHVLPLGGRVLWLHPPNTSAVGADLAKANGLHFVEGIDIADVAQQVSPGQ
jgi:predicted CoA-binding protein